MTKHTATQKLTDSSWEPFITNLRQYGHPVNYLVQHSVYKAIEIKIALNL